MGSVSYVVWTMISVPLGCCAMWYLLGLVWAIARWKRYRYHIANCSVGITIYFTLAVLLSPFAEAKTLVTVCTGMWSIILVLVNNRGGTIVGDTDNVAKAITKAGLFVFPILTAVLSPISITAWISNTLTSLTNMVSMIVNALAAILPSFNTTG